MQCAFDASRAGSPLTVTPVDRVEQSGLEPVAQRADARCLRGALLVGHAQRSRERDDARDVLRAGAQVCS